MLPKKRKLSQEQLEIHNALFDESDTESPSLTPGSNVATPNASQGVIEKELVVYPDGSTLDLTDAIQRAVNKQLRHNQTFFRPSEGSVSSHVGVGSQEPSPEKDQIQGLASHHPPIAHDMSSMSEESDSEQDSDSDIGELIGANVNSSAHKVSTSANAPLKLVHFESLIPGDLSSSAKSTSADVDVSAVPSQTPDTKPSETPEVGVDPDLPGCKKRKANFDPCELVVNWARGNFNEIPNAKEHIKQLEEEFIPVSSAQDLFSPIKTSEFLLKAMQDKDNVASDSIYFDRSKCERLLFKSQHLLSLSYSPFMDALTKLKDVPGASAARNLIGTGILAISSARHEISYARRELCRKNIRADIYPYLYSNPPTYNQLFGGDSIESQVNKAKQAAKDNQEFIYKKPKPKFTPNKSANSGFQGHGKSQIYQKQSAKRGGKGQTGNNSKRRKGKGKGQSSSSATKDNTNN